MPMTDARHVAFVSAGATARAVGLILSAAIGSRILSEAYLDSDRRWLPAFFGTVVLAPWLAAIWAWPPVRRPGWFLLAGTVASVMAAAYFTSATAELNTDISDGEVWRNALPPLIVTSFVPVLLVWFVIWRVARSR